MAILATLLALVTPTRPTGPATDDELLAVASAMGVVPSPDTDDELLELAQAFGVVRTPAADPTACPTWCMLPSGHAPEVVDDADGSALVVHRGILAVDVPAGRSLDLEQGVTVYADGSTSAEAPVVVVDGRVEDTLTAAQACRQAAALVYAAATLAGGAA